MSISKYTTEIGQKKGIIRKFGQVFDQYISNQWLEYKKEKESINKWRYG
jgi:hypothetical protein